MLVWLAPALIIVPAGVRAALTMVALTRTAGMLTWDEWWTMTTIMTAGDCDQKSIYHHTLFIKNSFLLTQQWQLLLIYYIFRKDLWYFVNFFNILESVRFLCVISLTCMRENMVSTATATSCCCSYLLNLTFFDPLRVLSMFSIDFFAFMILESFKILLYASSNWV